MADALGVLADDQANGEAWALFRQCVTRFTVDTHLAGVLLQRLTSAYSVEEFSDVAARLTVLYDALYPVDPKSET